MTISLELWHFILLVIAFLGGLAGIGKLLLDQVLRRMDDRFKSQEAATDAYQAQLTRRLDAMDSVSRSERENWQRVERELLNLKADIPLQYVRREDYIRGQSVLEAKLDAVSIKLDNVQLRTITQGVKHAN